MNLDSVIKYTDMAIQEIAKYKVSFILNVEKMSAKQYSVGSLNWDSIKYGKTELERVPNNKRGVYAFVVCLYGFDHLLPTHGYVMYIGMSGDHSDRPLRERYRDYLNEKKLMKRAHVARMIGTWHEVLRFFFAPVDDNVSSDDLKALENQLNTALLPPFAKGDLNADTKAKRGAFP